MTLRNIWPRESSQAENAVKKQLRMRNKANLDLDGWTWTNNLASTSVIAYYVLGTWAMSDVQLVFDEVDSLFCSCVES